MDRNYSEQELKTSIIKEEVAGTVYHYSIAKKDQKSLSLFSN